MVFLGIAVTLFIVGLPIWMILALRKSSLSRLMYGDKNRTGGSSGIGNALQELDRLLARPSIEYRIAAEGKDERSQDGVGGD